MSATMLGDIHLDLAVTKTIVGAELPAGSVCLMDMDARSLASASGSGIVIMTSLGRADYIRAISQLLAS